MPPSNMFSYLRGHRRTGSSPNSPQSTQMPSPLFPPDEPPRSPTLPLTATDTNSADPAKAPGFAPTLPPIPRVASKYEAEKRSTIRPVDSDGQPQQQPSFSQALDSPSAPLTARFAPQGYSRDHDRSGHESFAGPLRRIDEPQLERERTSSDSAGGIAIGEPHGYGYNSTQSFRRPFQRPWSPTKSKSFGMMHYSQAADEIGVQSGSTASASADGKRLLIPSSRPGFTKSASATTLGNEPTASPSHDTQGPSLQNSQPNPRSSKSKLNLLKPVNLLMRRRASHAEDGADTTRLNNKSLDVPLMSLPEDYDPRIRGKGVHDFSAPRTRRNRSSEDTINSSIRSVDEPHDHHHYGRQPSLSFRDGNSSDQEKSLPRSEPERGAYFREHFEEDGGVKPSNSAVHRESLANTQFLARMSRQLDLDSAEGFMQAQPVSLLDSQQVESSRGERTSKSTDAPSIRDSFDQSTGRSSASYDTKGTSPSHSPMPADFSGSSPYEHLRRSALKPHTSSTASRMSRFSFQLNNDRSDAQERALEERHREKIAARLRNRFSDVHDEFDEDNIDLDDMYDDGFEEPIPIVGEDPYEDDLQIQHEPISSRPWKPRLSLDTKTQVQESQPTVNEQVLSEPAASPSMPPERKVSDASAYTDDMYFDDGLIDEPDHDDGEYFDENSLDDFSSRVVESREVQNITTAFPLRTQSNQKMNTYHSALALAATEAAANGKFHREESVDSFGSGPIEEDSIFGTEAMNDDEGVDDDPMIAEANAEVLASEDSDYYGYEFGFYGSSGKAGGRFLNGGYFCDSDAEALARSVSGRNISREPNLTPITERSEFSTRNSFISLHAHSNSIPNSATSVQHPLNMGLQELAATMGPGDEDMSFAQLMKLRKHTFGSAGSGGSPSSSSLSMHSPQRTQQITGLGLDSAIEDDEYYEDEVNIYDSDEEDEDTLTADPLQSSNTQRLEPSSPAHTVDETPRAGTFSFHSPQPSPLFYANNTAPLVAPVAAAFRPQVPMIHAMPSPTSSVPLPSHIQLSKLASRPPASSHTGRDHHRRQSSGSGADSVTYIKEEDEQTGETKWYLERRRNLGDGQFVVVARELVPGGI